MTPRRISLLCRGLATLGAFSFIEVAHANPCEATAVLSGEPSLIAELSSMLAQRSISLQGAPGCAAIQASISSHGNQLMVVLQDTSGRSETFIVAELATAASLIEAWSRVAVEPILPPGIEALSATSSVREKPSFKQIEEEEAPIDEGANAKTSEPSQASKLKNLTLNAEHLPGGFRSDGIGLRASATFAETARFTLNADARGYQKPGGGNFSLLFASLNTDIDPTRAKALFQGIELLLRASAPLQHRRLSLVPSIAVGPGFLSAHELVSNLELPAAKTINVVADGQLAASYQVTKRIEVQAYYSMSTIILGRNNTAKEISFAFLGPLPDFQERLGAGLSYHF